MGVTAAIIMTGVGVGMGANSQYQAGKAAKQTAYLNAGLIEETAETNAGLIEEGTAENSAILEYNARMSEAKARDAIFRGRETEGRFRTDIRGLIGSQRASYGAQGIELDSGSALDVQTDTAYQGEMTALKLRTASALEAWGFNVDAEHDRMQAASVRKLGKLEAKNTRDVGRASAKSARLGGNYAAQAGTLGAASTIAGGAGSMLVQSYGYKRTAK